MTRRSRTALAVFLKSGQPRVLLTPWLACSWSGPGARRFASGRTLEVEVCPHMMPAALGAFSPADDSVQAAYGPRPAIEIPDFPS